MHKMMLALVVGLFASPVAAATVGSFSGPVFSPDSVGFLSNDDTQWNFGVTLDSVYSERWARRRGMDGGHSTVSLTASDACDTVAPATECLVGVIRYDNKVNYGAGSGVLDTASGSFMNTVLGFTVSFDLRIDRSTNRPCGDHRFGCPDVWYADLEIPDGPFRTVGSGGTVNEESFGEISIYWLRPGTDTEVSVVPLPASVLLLGAGVAALAAVRRRKPRA